MINFFKFKTGIHQDNLSSRRFGLIYLSPLTSKTDVPELLLRVTNINRLLIYRNVPKKIDTCSSSTERKKETH